MEELFKQSFNYARIRLFKNYSDRLAKNIVNGPTETPLPEKYDVYKDEIIPKMATSAVKPSHRFDVRLFEKGKRKTNFFYATNPMYSFVNNGLPDHPEVKFEPISLVCVKKHRDVFFETTKDRQIKRHYNNPFAELDIYKIERWIKQDGDKITIKKFTQRRHRELNSIYFTKHTDSTTLVFNIRTGNFVIVTFIQGHKSKVKHFYCNSFSSLKQSLSAFYNMNGYDRIDASSSLYKQNQEIFNIIPFQLAVKSALGLKEISFGVTPEIISENFVREWISRFVEIKKIKLPDNSERLLKWYYPTDRYLKKNGGKLIAAVLDRFGMKSKVTIKISHQYPNINLIQLKELCQLFGDEFPKYIGNIHNDFFGLKGIEYDESGKQTLKEYLTNGRRQINFNLSDYEKECIISILNDMRLLSQTKPIATHGIVGTFIDHFRIIERIKTYYPEIRLNARKFETFNIEHSLYSKYEREIGKGYTLELVFEDHIQLEIEKPITVVELDRQEPVMYFATTKERIEYEKWLLARPVSAIQRVFTPKLLTSSNEYDEEGSTQGHCVAGYINNTDYSIIVSLRLGTERVTCEYQIKDRKCTQARYYHNENPPPYFKKPLEMLDERMKSIPFPIKPIDVRKVPLVINGVIVKPQEDVVHAEFMNF